MRMYLVEVRKSVWQLGEDDFDGAAIQHAHIVFSEVGVIDFMLAIAAGELTQQQTAYWVRRRLSTP